jgi:hypothetical protein
MVRENNRSSGSLDAERHEALFPSLKFRGNRELAAPPFPSKKQAQQSMT